MKPYRKILIIRLDEIGDMVLTSPFLRELRRGLPDAWITLAARPHLHNLLETCPYINELVDVPTTRPGNGVAAWLDRLAVLRCGWLQLGRRQFDLAMLPRWGDDPSVARRLAHLAGARRVIGFRQGIRSGSRSASFVTEVLDSPGVAHVVEKSLELLTHLGLSWQSDRVELWPTDADRQFAAVQLATGTDGDRLRVAMGIGARHPRRIWPAERFAETARWLIETRGAKIVLTGGPGDDRRAEEISQAVASPNLLDLTGRATLRQSAAILERCSLHIGNDTGSLHLAVAARCPVVEISPAHKDCPRFGTNRWFYPWKVPYRLLVPAPCIAPCTDYCAAADAHCIKEVSVANVQQAVTELLNESAERQP